MFGKRAIENNAVGPDQRDQNDIGLAARIRAICAL